VPSAVPPAASPSSIPFACLTISAVSLGIALEWQDGFYHPVALALLSVALMTAVAGVFRLRAAPPAGTRGALALRALLGFGLALQLGALLYKSPGLYVQPDASVGLFRLGVIVQATCVAAAVLGIRSLARFWFPALLATTLALGAWMLTASPDPQIDVVEVHRAALRALGRGRNPYDITFRNIYGARSSAFYNPDAVVGDRVQFGYPYPPLSLLLVAPGQMIFKDYRYAQLIATVGAAALIGYGGGGLLAALAASLFVTTPRLYFVLEQGWTEPIALLLLALTSWTMLRRPGWTPWAAGAMAVTKQYLGLAAPLIWRYAGSASIGVRRFLERAVLVATVVTLPFVLWKPRAFIDTVILLQLREPFRIDSLSYASWAARAGFGRLSFLWALAAATLALIIVFRRIPNNAAGFAAGLAVTTFCSFAVGSKAFCNYYFFVVGALCTAMAALSAPGAFRPDRSELPNGSA
jgi:hypothetical protein